MSGSATQNSRRRLITGGLAAVAGATGLGVAARLAKKYGLVPPDGGGIYGPGETLNYKNQISKPPFANEIAKPSDEFKRLQAGGFADWRLTIDGLVERPGTFSVAQLRSYPSRGHITELACEEGWSYIAEWNGVPLSHVLDVVGVKPQAKFVVYISMEPNTWDSIDIDEAQHPQTLIAYGMNDKDLPVAHGGPLRMRVPRQLGYKNVKFINHLTVTDDIKKFGKGQGSVASEFGYKWFAGI
jgi:DMSO/TMAO reductase YedYZ molybdopterin-dependent catalytic subunit